MKPDPSAVFLFYLVAGKIMKTFSLLHLKYTIILQTPGGKKQENFIKILPFDGSAALC